MEVKRPISEVFLEDCLIGMSRYPDKFFDLVIADPPYGKNMGRANYINASETKTVMQKNGQRLAIRKNQYKGGDWDKTPPTIEYFLELRRISKEQIIWGWENYGLDWGPGLIKWNKIQPDGVGFSKYEVAFCSLLDREIEFKYLWAGFAQAKSLAEPEIQQGNKRLNERRIHPTQKPVGLYLWLLKKFGSPGGKIIDTHMGSQSSRIAAFNMGFDYWGWEIDKEYFEAGNKRFKEQTAQMQIF